MALSSSYFPLGSAPLGIICCVTLSYWLVSRAYCVTLLYWLVCCTHLGKRSLSLPRLLCSVDVVLVVTPKKNVFRHFGPQFGLKIRRGRPPRAPDPLDPPLVSTYLVDWCSTGLFPCGFGRSDEITTNGHFYVRDVLYQAQDAVFHHQMKHREESWKNDAQRSIFDELRGVSSGDETLCRMLDITSQTKWF